MPVTAGWMSDHNSDHDDSDHDDNITPAHTVKGLFFQSVNVKKKKPCANKCNFDSYSSVA